MSVEADVAALKAENTALKKRIDDLEELLSKVRHEVSLIKQFEWGSLEDPPTIKKDVC